jgi:hypothetical protein
MKTTIFIIFSLFVIPVSLIGQTNSLQNKSQDLKKDSTKRERKFNIMPPVYHYNEIPQNPENKILGDDKRIFEFNRNRRYMQPEMKNIFRPGYKVVNGNRKYSLSLDNMPCLVPETNGKLIIKKPDQSAIFY